MVWIFSTWLSHALLSHTYVMDTKLQNNLESTINQACQQHPDRRHGAALASTVARLLRWRGDVAKELHRGDRLQLLYQQEEGEPVIFYLNYQGASIQLSAIRMDHPQLDPYARYYTPAGVGVEPVMQQPPAAYEAITELVMRQRGHRHHDGIDLKAPVGTPIYAIKGGTVRRRNWLTRYNGLCLEIMQEDGLLARFLHLHKVAPGLGVGTTITPGMLLGQVGSTGRSNGAHLHYELWRQGKAIEPLDYHGRSTRQLPSRWLPQLTHLAQVYADSLQVAQSEPWVALPTGEPCVALHPQLLAPFGCSNWLPGQPTLAAAAPLALQTAINVPKPGLTAPTTATPAH